MPRLRLPETLVRGIGLCTALLTLSGCQIAAHVDINSRYYRIPVGSELILTRPVSIPAGQAHINFQRGGPANAIDQYSVNCQLETSPLGPLTLQPGSFTITRVEDSLRTISYPDIIRYYKVIYLHSDSQPAVRLLMCQYWSDPLRGGQISLQRIESALGEHLVFRLAGAEEKP